MTNATEPTSEAMVMSGFKNARQRSRHRSALDASGLFFGVEPFMSRLGQMSAQNSPAEPKHRAVEHEQHDGHPDEEG